MTVMAYRQGNVVAYYEMSVVMTGTLNANSTNVTAAFDSMTMTMGFRLDNTITYPDGAETDLEGILNGRYQPAVQGTRKELGDSTQRTIRDLIAYVRRRCPA